MASYPGGIRLREGEIGTGRWSKDVGRGVGGEPGRADLFGKIGETLFGDGPYDSGLAGEMAVPDGLAVFDMFGRSVDGQRVPALRFGGFSGGVDDALMPFGPFAFFWWAPRVSSAARQDSDVKLA